MASEGKNSRKVGECKWFNSKKGFGFITSSDGSEDVFVHQSAIHAIGFRSLAEKEQVEYETAIDEKGRVKALNVTGPQGAHVKGAPKPRPRYFNRRRDENGETSSAPSTQSSHPAPVQHAPTPAAPAASHAPAQAASKPKPARPAKKAPAASS